MNAQCLGSQTLHVQVYLGHILHEWRERLVTMCTRPGECQRCSALSGLVWNLRRRGPGGWQHTMDTLHTVLDTHDRRNKDHRRTRSLSFPTVCGCAKMSDKACTLRTRKFLKNPLLGRRQFVRSLSTMPETYY